LSYGCRRPALVHSLWVLVLLKLITPPLVPVRLPWAILPPWGGGAPDVSASPEPIDFETQVAELPAAVALEVAIREGPEDVPDSLDVSPAPGIQAAPSSWLPANWAASLAPLWLAGSLGWFVWNCLHIYRFQRLLRYAQPAPSPLQDRVKTLAGRLGLKQTPAIWLVPGALSPMVWPVGRTPCLLFPAKLLERLDREQLDTLLVHELAHVRRRDHWVRMMELVVVALYWWHPVVWWARRELHEAEEQCCDAWVVWALRGAGRAYALA